MSKLITLFVATALSAAALSAQSPDAAWYGLQPGDAQGSVVAVIGDCDADGVPDIALGAPYADHHITSPFEFTIANVGHVQVRSGATGSVLFDLYGTQAGAEFGYALAGADDIDGDGHDDLLVGIPKASGLFTEQGQVQIRSGATGVLLRSHWGPQAQARFGHSVVSGLPKEHFWWPANYAVGAPLYDIDDSTGGYAQEGLVRVFTGYDGTVSTTLYGGTYDGGEFSAASSDYRMEVKHFGWAIDNWGFYFSVGAPLTDRVHKVTGELTAVTGFAWVKDWISGKSLRHWGTAGSRTGASLDFGTDVPGGSSYLVVGSPGTAGNGRVEVLSMHWSTFPQGLDLVSSVNGTPTRKIGSAVALVGDVNHDGVGDVAIGSPDTSTGSPFGIAQVGAVSVVSSASGATLAEYFGDAAFDHLGSAVAGADFNGDGFAELLFGAPGDDGPAGLDSGATRLYDSNLCHALNVVYGSGHPGTTSTPTISYQTNPTLGSTYNLWLTNSLGAPTQAWFFVGFAPAAIPLKDATLLVSPFTILTLPLGTNGLALSPQLPEDPALCGVSVFLQALVIDPGASRGVAFSKGLELRLGY